VAVSEPTLVGELPRLHRSDVGLELAEQVHRVRVLEQDGDAFGRDERASDERRVAPHGHGRRSGRIPHVRFVEQQARLDVVAPHRILESGQTPLAQSLDIHDIRSVSIHTWEPSQLGVGAEGFEPSTSAL